MTIALITPPAIMPVTLAALREHLRITEPDEDGYLADRIAAATAHTEQVAGRKLVTQTWRRYADGPCRAVPLHLSPVQRIETVTLYDGDGTPSEASPEDWRLVGNTLHLDHLTPGAAENGIEIDVRCGYGDAPADVPAPIRHAILMLAAHWHEFRGAVAPDDQPVSLPPGFAALLAPFREVRL